MKSIIFFFQSLMLATILKLIFKKEKVGLLYRQPALCDNINSYLLNQMACTHHAGVTQVQIDLHRDIANRGPGWEGQLVPSGKFW